MLKKPERYYKNIYDCAQKFSWCARKWNDDGKIIGVFPCLACKGYGWIHRDEDFDCVEGYKLAPRYTCKKCGGTGQSSRKEFKVFYDRSIHRYKSELTEWKRLSALKKSAISKLSKEEIKALQELGI